VTDRGESDEQRQAPLVHERPDDNEPLDSNEHADDAIEVRQPDGEPIERDDS
jgi:hypothetical protein